MDVKSNNESFCPTSKIINGISIRIGDVYYTGFDREEGMVIPDNSDEFHSKYFVILGFHDCGFAIGTVFINSKINFNAERTLLPEEIINFHYPLKKTVYPKLDHNSFIDCSYIYDFDCFKILVSEYMFTLSEEDLELIKATVRESPKIKPKKLKMYNL